MERSLETFQETETPHGSKRTDGVNTGTESPGREVGTAYACDLSTYKVEAGGWGISPRLHGESSPGYRIPKVILEGGEGDVAAVGELPRGI